MEQLLLLMLLASLEESKQKENEDTLVLRFEDGNVRTFKIDHTAEKTDL